MTKSSSKTPASPAAPSAFEDKPVPVVEETTVEEKKPTPVAAAPAPAPVVPTIGRAVHIQIRAGVVRPAKIVDVRKVGDKTVCDLHVSQLMNDGEGLLVEKLGVEEGTLVGTWSWPPRV